VPSARSRLNTLYMVGRFMGGAAGSAICAFSWSKYRWTGVSLVNVTFLVLAMIVHLVGWNWQARSAGDKTTGITGPL
jgi:hypothetical protein